MPRQGAPTSNTVPPTFRTFYFLHCNAAEWWQRVRHNPAPDVMLQQEGLLAYQKSNRLVLWHSGIWARWKSVKDRTGLGFDPRKCYPKVDKSSQET